MDFGGHFRFTYAGNPLTVRGSFTSQPSNVTFDGGANTNGSLYRTISVTGYVFDMTFQVRSSTGEIIDWDGIMKGGPYNMTMVEEDTGYLHTWTGAQFEGTPSADYQSGEMTGITMRSVAYNQTTS